MIRDVTLDDKEQILRLIEMFYKERLEKEGASFSRFHADKHFDQIMQTPNLVALCAELDGKIVGVLAGVLSVVFFAKELALQELVWYVEPRERKQGLSLLREFERRAKELNASLIMMVGMSGDAVLKTYPRLGYTETQRTFMKRI